VRYVWGEDSAAVGGWPCQKGASVGHQGGVVTIEAKPESIRIDLGKCAVLVIDMQNDFGAKGGMFNRAGIDISPIERAVAPTMRAVAAAMSGSPPVRPVRVVSGCEARLLSS
jgi:hypothetical protein